MPHVYQPTYTREIPTSAERVTVKGVKCVRWKGRQRQWVTGVVCVDKPTRCRVTSPVWRIAYSGPNGEEMDVPGYADRAASEAKMAALVQTSARISAGLLPPEAARPRQTIPELLDRWRKYVAGGRAEQAEADRQHQRAGDVIAGVGAVRPADLTAPAVRAWLAKTMKANRHKGRRFGPTTAGNYLTAIKAFTRWLAVVDRSEPADHLSALRREADQTELRHQRRALSPEELGRLLEAARTSPETHFGLTGTHRHALYLLACSTGLRASELSSLTPASFVGATVVIEAGRAKNRKRETLPVPAGVLEAVRATFPATGAVWPNRGRPSRAWWTLGAEMLRRDLEAAGIAYKVGGKAYDFHSLRVQLATDLDRAGVSLSRAQKLMRHSTPGLTSKFYQRPEADELALEVAKLDRANLGVNLVPVQPPQISTACQVSTTGARPATSEVPKKRRRKT